MLKAKRYATAALQMLMMLLFVGSITGVSYTSHYCNGRLSGTAFYPELGLQQPVGCGCPDDYSPAKHLTNTSESFQQGPCCKNVSVNNRVTSEFQPSGNQVFPKLIVCLNDNSVFAGERLQQIIIKVVRAAESPPSGRLSGKALVHFICAMRIPPDGSC